VSGDYLWDGNGPRDPEVVRLERMLEPLRPGALPPLAEPVAPVTRRNRIAAVIGVVGIAASLVLAAVVWSDRTPAPSLAVTRVSGAPLIESRAMTDQGTLKVGRRLETNADARASIDIAGVGRVDVDPGTRLSLVNTRPGDYRLRLETGTLHALIWAPPGQFFIETPSSTAVDLGCAYTLTVDKNGEGLVRVTTGWVGFEWHGRESFIPAGAVCTTRRDRGPGTPHYDDVSEAVKAAIRTIDEGSDEAGAVPAALSVVLAEARPADVVTLWHLLSRVDGAERDRVFDRLAAIVPPPTGVTREGIRSGRRDMLDLWWDSLGLGTASWWRTWKQPWK